MDKFIKALLITISIFNYSASYALQKLTNTTKDVLPFNAVVDQSGNGTFKSIQQAIDHAPEARKEPWCIFIANGRYEELIRIPEDKPFIYLIGQSKDKTIITFKINCGDANNLSDPSHTYANKNFGQSTCATVVVDAPDFYAENISFENAWGVEEQSGPQALAIRTNNDRFAFYNCIFRSFQDTWMTSSKGVNDRTYANKCWLEGAVDYFYGGGNAFIENTTLYNVRSGSVIVAPGHKEETKWGYIFDHCIIDGNNKAADGRLKLGRPWHNRPIAVFLNSVMKIPIHPEGWTDMGPAAKLFAEYNSQTLDGKSIDLTKRRTWYNERGKDNNSQHIEGLTAVLTKNEAAQYTYENVIGGDDGWDPRKIFQNIPPPINTKLRAGKLTWKGDKSARGFLISQGERIISYTASSSYQLTEENKSDIPYRIQAINKSGSLGEPVPFSN